MLLFSRIRNSLVTVLWERRGSAKNSGGAGAHESGRGSNGRRNFDGRGVINSSGFEPDVWTTRTSR